MLNTETFSECNISLYWINCLRGIWHAGRSVISAIVCGVFITWDDLLCWTQGYLMYVTFGHCLRDI
jgi:hypothetical protein